MNIAIFPGTFNPVHKGHLLIAQKALEKFDLDKIYFVLSPNPPNKLKEENILSALQRQNLLEIALKNNKNFELSLLELEREGISYTIDTIKYFCNKLNEKNKLKLILGFDAFLSLPSWKEADQIKNLCHFLVAGRQKESTDYDFKQNIFYTDLIFDFIDNPLIDISATEIRNKKAHNINYKNLLPTKVFETYKQFD